MSSATPADVIQLDQERRAAGHSEADKTTDATDGATDAPDASQNTPSPSTEAAVLDDGLPNAGAMLAAARSASGLSVGAVAERTNITVERIHAIEEMRVQELPAAPYTLGFVRSYAHVVDLPAQAVVDRFRLDAGYPKPTTAPVIEPKLKRDLGPPKQVSLFAVLGVLIFAVWVVWQVLQAAAPDEPVEVAGVPLTDRLRTQTGVTYQVETSLEDDVANIPGADAMTAQLQGDSPADGAELITPLPSDIELTFASDEEVLKEKTPLAQSDAQTGEGDGTAVAADGSEMPTPTVRPGAEPAADDLNARLLNELTPADEDQPVTAAESASAGGNDNMAIQPIELAPAPAPQPVPTSPSPRAAEETTNSPPIIRLAVEPVYPARCENGAADEEQVTVSFSVSRYGKVRNPSVTRSTNDCFNNAALAAISRWDFEPAQDNGRSVDSPSRTTRVIFQRPQ